MAASPAVRLSTLFALAISALSGPGPTPALAQSTFHGSIARDGVFPGAGPTQAPTLKWKFQAGGPVVTSPAVVDGVVYIAALDGHLYALDEATGAEKWNFKSRMPIASSPTIDQGTVYFVSSTGALAALDATNGQPKWVFACEYERRFEAKGLHGYPGPAQTIPDAWDLFTSSPAVVGNRAYFGSGDGGVYCVDTTSGLLQWKFSTGDVVHASPAVVEGTVYIGSWDSNLYALDAESGRKKWAFKTGEDPAIHNQVGFQGSPAVVGGVVYVGCRDAHVYAIDAATGKKVWDYPTSKSWVIGTPAVRDGVVYVGTSDSSRLMALDAASGRLRFNVDAKAYMFSSPALAGGTLYVGDHNGSLYAINASTGAISWEFQTDAAKADPQKLLTPEHRLNQDTFAPLFHDFQDMYLDFGRFASIGAIMSSPAVHDGVVFFGSLDGRVYAVK